MHIDDITKSVFDVFI